MRHDLPIYASIRKEALISQVMNDTVKRPAARVEFIPAGYATPYDIAFTSFEITQRTGAIDAFSLSIPGNEPIWDMVLLRPFSTGLASDRLKFYVEFGGWELPIFQGIPMEKRDAWPPPTRGAGEEGWRGGDDPITLTGHGLLGLLKHVDGMYYGTANLYGTEPIPFTGDIVGLIRYFLWKANLYGSIIDLPSYGSGLPYHIKEPMDINYSDGYQAVTSLAANIHPAGMIMVTPEGQVRVRRGRGPDWFEESFNYSDIYDEDTRGFARLMHFERTWRHLEVVTKCMVIWKEGAEVVESSALKAVYGTQPRTLHLPMVETAGDARQAAQAVIDDSNRWDAALTATVNPYLHVGSVIRVRPRMGGSGQARRVEVVGRQVNVTVEGGEITVSETLQCRALELGQEWL